MSSHDAKLVQCLAIPLVVATVTQGRDFELERLTGNLSIISYRKPFLAGETPETPDPMLREIARLEAWGVTGVEDYVTYDVLEPSRGDIHADPYQANARACRRHRLDYAVYPWVHFAPDWVRSDRDFVPYTNLEDGTSCRQPSGWAPFTRKAYLSIYARLSRHLRRDVHAVYVADCSEYGELGYPNGYTKWLRQDENSKVAWWCGDPHAMADFRITMLRKYGSPGLVGQQWGVLIKDRGEIGYPPMALLKSNPDPAALGPQQRQWILDFVYWYQDASAHRMEEFLTIAREAFPDVPYEIKLGHADERAIMGHSYSSACQILRNVPRLGIRSTHAAVSYFHVKRVSTPARYYGFERFTTEPPGEVTPDRMPERLFTDACVGVTAYFDYPANPPRAGERFSRYIGLLDGTRARVDVALVFPESDHYLRIDKTYPDGLLQCANALRDVADYDVIDERLIADGALDHYDIVVLVGDPVIEPMTWERFRGMARREDRPSMIQVLQERPVTKAGEFMCVDGQRRALPGRRDGTPFVTLVIDEPDGQAMQDAVTRAYAGLLIREGMEDDLVGIVTSRDGVWAGLFDHRVLLYNPGDDEARAGRLTIGPREILSFERR